MVPRAADRYDTSTPKLDVTLRELPTGMIGESGPDIWFKYDDAIVRADSGDRLSAHAVSVRMPVIPAPYDHNATLVFFDNLLLESDTRAELAQLERRDASDVAGLLGRVGAECAGAVSVWPHGSSPMQPTYRRLSIPEVEALFDERHGERISHALLESRQVMSGAQRKLVLRRDGDAWALPLNGAPSTHLLKRSSGRYDGLVANELACLRLAKAIGLPVPEASSVGSMGPWPDGRTEPRLIAVTRFDRVVSVDASADALREFAPISRLHQEDLCQITGRRPSAKYQIGGGPTLRDLATTIRRYSTAPDIDLQNALTMAIANVCLGNGDAHGKNFALLSDADGARRLAPFYDIVSTDVYPALASTFSMVFGHADRASALSAHDLGRVSRDFGVTPSLVRESVERVATMLPEVLDGVLDSVERDVGVVSPVLGEINALVGARAAQLEGLLVS
jgi:serine/threonine-protein kinase HipA